jgi:hypothetical membrane protein
MLARRGAAVGHTVKLFAAQGVSWDAERLARERLQQGHKGDAKIISSPGSAKLARRAAATWLVGGTLYVACEAVAAARYPGYRYVGNYISDLGTSAVMNVGGFTLHGLLFALGAGLAVRAYPTTGGVGRAFVVAAAANAIGNVLVGTFHSGTPHSGVNWHVLGAGLAIVGGNAAVILAGSAGARLGAPVLYRRTSVALGIVGLACLAALIVDGSHVVPVGILERGAVYPIIAWELMTGIALVRRLRVQRP